MKCSIVLCVCDGVPMHKLSTCKPGAICFIGWMILNEIVIIFIEK